jgi:hypothetical protein
VPSFKKTGPDQQSDRKNGTNALSGFLIGTSQISNKKKTYINITFSAGFELMTCHNAQNFSPNTSARLDL